MLNFCYSIPTEIFFGKGEIKNIGKEIKKYGNKVLITYGSQRIKESGLFQTAAQLLETEGIQYWELGGIQPNPRISSVREGLKICRNNQINFILAIGGGSVIDTSKAIAAGYYYNGDPWHFFVKIASVENALPIGCILTLAATGSEMNGNSVISQESTKQKLAIGHPVLRPKFSILDPTYTFSVPPDQTAAGIADIMSHIFEQYFSPTPQTAVNDRLAEALLNICIEYGAIAIKEPENYEARANVLWASSLALNGLIGFGKVGDWASHAIEHGVSAISDITHGIGLAIITPAWMHYVLDNKTVDKFATFAKNVWKLPDETDKMALAQKGIEKTREFFLSLGLPGKLKDMGIPAEDLESMADKTVEFGEPGNLKQLSRSDVLKILHACY